MISCLIQGSIALLPLFRDNPEPTKLIEGVVDYLVTIT